MSDNVQFRQACGCRVEASYRVVRAIGLSGGGAAPARVTHPCRRHGGPKHQEDHECESWQLDPDRDPLTETDRCRACGRDRIPAMWVDHARGAQHRRGTNVYLQWVRDPTTGPDGLGHVTLTGFWRNLLGRC